jgi:replicative DNA helicase
VSTALETRPPAQIVPHGRVPPHNLDAERSLLGGILLDSQAFADVVEVVRAEEFYRDAHRKVFEAMSALFGRALPIDRITVKDELTAQGCFEAVGGDEFIDLLDKIVPTAANLGYYAKIVHDKALARRLIEAASAIAQLGYEQHGEVGEFADECERRIFSVTEQRNSISFEAVRPVIARVFKNIEALYERQEEITGVPTGFADLDRLTSGFQPGDLVILAARPSMGKAQPLDAPVLTPSGYLAMGEIKAGSLVVGADGKSHRVLAVFPQGEKPVFRVRFSDGGEAECCDEHLWQTTTRVESRRPGGRGSVKSLAEIRQTLRVVGEPDRLNHRIPTVAPVAFVPRERPLLLAPYLMGLLLGDGSFRGFTIRFDGAEADVHERLRSHLPQTDTVSIDGITARIRRRWEEPTGKMHEVLAAIAGAGSTPPSIRELCNSTGTTYTNALHDRLVRLRSKGLVEWDRNRKRTLRLTEAGIRRAGEEPPAPRRSSATRAALEQYGLRGLSSCEKFIPNDYLYASPAERLDLLRGLLDTDGHVIVPGGRTVEYTTTSPRLADGVVWLVRSLGGIISRREKSTSYEYRGEHRTGAPATRIRLWFPNGIVPISSKKHLARWNSGADRFLGRFIESVEPAGAKPCQCILIDSDDHLYVTSDFVVTHNTACCLNIATHVGCRAQYQKKRCGVAIFSLEMPKEQLVMRMLSSEARVDSQRIRTGKLIESDWAKLAQAAGVLADANIHIDDSPAVSALELRAKSRRLFAKHENTDAPIRLIIVDYLQLMRGNERIDSREQQISEISRSLKALAKELGIPLLALSQLNRSLEKRPDKRPMMSDLRESGALEQDADTIMFIFREEVYEKEKEDVKGVAEIIIGKQRNGPIGAASLAFIHEHTRFENLAREYVPRGGE